MENSIKGTRITLSGLGGVGKGTVSKELKTLLGYDLKSAGDFFRSLAAQMNVPLAHLEELARKDSKYDKEVDERTATYGIQNDRFICEGRLPWYFIKSSYKILLICEEEVRIARISKRDNISFAEADRLTRHREEMAAARYASLYGIRDITDPRNFDLVIDTTRSSSEDNAIQILRNLKVSGDV